MKKRFTSITLIIAIIISLVSIPTEANAASKVTSYTYEVKPLLAPFNGYVYVKTNNPDPMSFRLIDKSSKYITSTSTEKYGKGIYHLQEILFSDVLYEKESTFRVKGGYIFCNNNFDSDGGQLVVQEVAAAEPARISFKNGKISGYSGNMSYGWKDTSIKVSCPTLKTYTDYLIDEYTKDKTDFFDKMDAVQYALYTLSLYPRDLFDKSKPDPNKPYPFLATSPYAELSLNEHYDIYQSSTNPLLLVKVYPYILNSASFPATMQIVAKDIEPNCTIEGSGHHAYFNLSFNGVTRMFGGAGEGGNQAIYTDRVTKDYTFNNSQSDYGTHGTLQTLKNRYLKYGEDAVSDNAVLKKQISREAVAETISPGSWALVATEGMFGYGKTYAYLTLSPSGTSYIIASNAWVDGRYVDKYEGLLASCKFEDYPTADIILRNVSYVDINGKSHQGDIIYSYDSKTDTWRAPDYYKGQGYYGTIEELPSKFILTREQVKSMGVDRNNNRIPDSVRIYDGSDKPGTLLINKHVESISVPKEVTILTGQSKYVPITFNPANPTITRLLAESSNPDIVSAGDGGYLYGEKPGTANVTFISLDGHKKATCKVTVEQAVESIKINNGITQLDIDYAKKEKLTANILPENAKDKSIVWSSDNPDIVSVDSKGNIIGKSIGYARITAKNTRSDVSCTIGVTVNRVRLSEHMVSLSKESFMYTGKAHKPKVSVVSGKQKLVEGTDFTVAYYNNIDCRGNHEVTIQGIGNYDGVVKKTFEIKPIVVPIPEGKKDLIYNGKPQTGVPAGEHYTVSNNKATKARKYYAIIELESDNYIWNDDDTWFRRVVEWEIAPLDISKTTVDAIPDQVFNGYYFYPSPIIKYKNTELMRFTDYDLNHINNRDIGIATVTITGTGNFTGEKKVKFRIIEPPHEHRLYRIENQAATCTSPGNKTYWTCWRCEKVFSDSKATKETTIDEMKIAATGHSLTKMASKAATCTEQGNKAYWTCSGCSKVFSDSKGTKETTIDEMKIAATGHSLTKTAAKASTCAKAGNKAYWTCSTCKKVFSDSKGAKETTVAKMKIAATGHKWDLGKITKQPTEKAEGVKTYTCSACKATKTEKIPKLEPAAPTVAKSVRRAYGDDRYDTAFAISDAYLVDSGKVKSVGDIAGGDRSPSLGAIIVACGTNYPDALAASYLASVKKAPVIVWREKDNAKVQEYIKANLKRGGYVYIMGGTGAVSGNIAKGLSGYKFVRYGDENRYGTNVKILTAAKVTGGEILVCDGTDFKNALIASATGKPILLVKPTGVTREGLAFIAGLNKPSFTIIGNEGSVAASVETQLAGYGKVTRISGNTPDEVSVNVAKKFFRNPKEVMVATSVNFPDGLCGGLLAIQNKAPMLLLTDKQNSKSVAYTKALTSLERVTAFGGPAVVSDTLTKKLLNTENKATDILEYYRTTDNTTGQPVLMVEPGKI